MKDGKCIDVHQAIHGYDEGHRLINTSFALNAKDAKTMLIMSDASGPGAIIPELGYLTGYPLPDSGVYALARTWAAVEKKRPGCVWTHTLLIDFADLAVLNNIEILVELFSKPRDSTASDMAREALRIENLQASTKSNFGDLEATEKILFSLYKRPKEQIIGSSNVRSEEMLLSIWAQQWPRLRRNFRFCSLAFSNRSTKNAPFDVQLIPKEDKTVAGRFKGCCDALLLSPVNEEWFEEARLDLFGPCNSELRRFLRDAGRDVVGGREAFAPLCLLFRLIKEAETNSQFIDRVIHHLTESFATNSGGYIKEVFANFILNQESKLSLNEQVQDFIIENVNPTSQDPLLHQHLQQFVERLWMQNPQKFMDLFENSKQLLGIAEKVVKNLPCTTIIAGLSQLDTERQVIICNRRPELITERPFWKDQLLTRAGLQTLIFNRDLANDTVDNIICNDRTELASIVLFILGAAAILQSLNRLLKTSLTDDSTLSKWINGAVEDSVSLQSFLLEETEIAAILLMRIALELPPDVAFDTKLDPWSEAVKKSFGTLRTAESQLLSAYLLRRALGENSLDTGGLLAVSLDEIYFGAMYSNLSHEAWGLVENKLPDLGFIFSWDRCQRIRVAVGDAVIRKNLSAEEFMVLTKDDQLFAELVKIIRRKGRIGKDFLKSVLILLLRSGKSLSRRYSIEDVL